MIEKLTGLLGLLFISLWLAVIGAWGVNGYKLTQCDFQAPVKCEVIHAVGLIPFFSLFTVWAATDSVAP